ncbi:hypothetical protein [Sphingobium sp. UBA5915]|uniref:hypothetical protein n=1 Tax=Sphingobium sp. UBA5915 TaxID=1947530 RepID=UPI0025E15F1F|nr:hypothetical protein [Sphingobium sp. UBA5915]
MTDLALSRRAVTRALFLTPVLAAPAAVSPAPLLVCPSAGPSAELSNLISDYHAKASACTAHGERVFQPARDAWQAAVEAIPHKTTKAGYRYFGEVRHLSTARPDQVAAAKSAVEMKPAALYSQEYAACCAELRNLVAEREAERVSVDQKHGISALLEENNRLSDAAFEALCLVELFEARTITDLVAKVDFIEETSGQVDIETLRADLLRISGEGRA